LRDRLTRAALKPAPNGGGATPVDEFDGVEEIEAAIRHADDRERIIGLVAAPLAAAVALLVMGALISNDPAALLSNGQPNSRHVSLPLYHELLIVLVALAVLILIMAWFRKRLYLGITLALFGLAIFNLHYWGFGVPFVMAGAWYLVRSYRLQRRLREATGDGPWRDGSTRSGRSPRSNKRYTPPGSRSGRPR
jgi:hypothetical protein